MRIRLATTLTLALLGVPITAQEPAWSAGERAPGNHFFPKYYLGEPLDDEPNLERVWQACVREKSMPVDVLQVMTNLLHARAACPALEQDSPHAD